jgi:hypothetical protein
MTTHHREPVVCECGHKGIVHWSENDQPFSKQWEEYSISGFDGEGFYVDGWTTVGDALLRMKPKCPKCGAVGKVTNA